MRAWPFLFALGACADPAIEMSLKLPQQPAGFDVSCVTSIQTIAVGEFEGDELNPPDVEGDCIDVKGMSTFDDIRRAMAGQFTIDLPESGLVGVTVRGSTGACDDVPDYHEAVFYGGAPATGDSIQIPIVANLSCSARGKVVSVHPVDVLALSTTKQCPVTTNGQAFSGNYRPLLLGNSMPKMTFESGSSASSQWTAGTTRLEVFSQAASPQTCIGAGYGSQDLGGSRCIEDAQPTLCAPAGEIELPIASFDFVYLSRDPDLVEKYGEPVLGVVWETSTATTKAPVANATVTLEDPTQGTVVYVEKGPTRFVPRVGAAGTATDGFFMVYVKGAPTNITVTSPLHNSVRYKIATSADYPATLLAALTRR